MSHKKDVNEIITNIRHAGHPGQTDDEVLEDYMELSSHYDQELLQIDYQGHLIVDERMCQTFDDAKRPDVKVLDIGAGTGLVGNKLRRSGFTRIDALDPSVDMLAVAKKRGIYENYLYEYITGQPTSIQEGLYDAVVGAAIFGHCHVPTEALYEMVRVVKPGGHIILVTRHEIIHIYDQYKDLESTMARLENNGVWRKVERAILPKFYETKEAILWHYQKI